MAAITRSLTVAVLRADFAASCLRGALPDDEEDSELKDSYERDGILHTSSRLAGGLLGTGHGIVEIEV